MEQTAVLQHTYPQEFIDALGAKDFNKADVGELLKEFQLNVSLSEISIEARSIVVTEETQTQLMQQAHDLRMKLRTERVRIEKIKDEIKRPYLRKTQLIDGINRAINRMFKAEEEYLQQQEDFAKIKQQQRIAAIAETRRERLLAFNFTGEISGLGSISDANFDLILAGAKASFELHQADLARQEQEEKERLEREAKLREENERFRLEKEEADRKAREAEAEIKKQKEEVEKKERDRIAAEEAEAKRIAEEATKAALAPDREKLLVFADAIAAVPLPVVVSDEARKAIEQFKSEREGLVNNIKATAENLHNIDCPF